MPSTRAIATLVAVCIVTLTTPAVAASAGGATSASADSTHPVGTTVTVDVDDTGAVFEVRTADERLFVAQAVPDDDELVLDTTSMDPGEYVVVNAETDDVVAEFALKSSETTGTNETDETRRPSNDTAGWLDETASDGVPTDATTVRGDSVQFLGQRLRFVVDGNGTYVLQTTGGTFVGESVARNGSVYVDTASLSPGQYLLTTPGGETEHALSLVDQSLDAQTTRRGVLVESNREPYTLSVAGLPKLTLLEAIPAATVRGGDVVVAVDDAGETLAVRRRALPDGESTIRLRVADTNATATVTVSGDGEGDTGTDGGSHAPGPRLPGR